MLTLASLVLRILCVFPCGGHVSFVGLRRREPHVAERAVRAVFAVRLARVLNVTMDCRRVY